MSARSATSTVVIPMILAVAFAAVLMAMLRQHAELKQIRADYAQLLQRTRSEPEAGASQAVGGSPVPVGETPAPAGAPISVETGSTRPRVPAPEPEPGFFGPIQSTGLELVGTDVVAQEGGLKAIMRFSPTQSESPGTVAVVVRLPRDSSTSILDLMPGGAMQFSDVRTRVTADGKFAVWQGTAENAEALELALTVSGDAVADVRGTAGIGPFDLDISGLEAAATPK